MRENLAKIKDEMADNIERLCKANAKINRLRSHLEDNNVARDNAQAKQQNLQYNQ